MHGHPTPLTTHLSRRSFLLRCSPAIILRLGPRLRYRVFVGERLLASHHLGPRGHSNETPSSKYNIHHHAVLLPARHWLHGCPGNDRSGTRTIWDTMRTLAFRLAAGPEGVTPACQRITRALDCMLGSSIPSTEAAASMAGIRCPTTYCRGTRGDELALRRVCVGIIEENERHRRPITPTGLTRRSEGLVSSWSIMNQEILERIPETLNTHHTITDPCKYLGN